MKFIILLISLGLERGLHIGRYLYRFSWFEKYVDFLYLSLNKTGLWRSFSAVGFIVIPLLLIVAIVYYSLHSLLFHIIGYLIALFVLLYCLGPDDLYVALNRYFFACESGNDEAGFTHIEKFVGEKPSNPGELHRAVTKSIFVHFNENIFAVLFWFVILGPLGAVLYRSVSLTRIYAQKEGSQHAEIGSSAQYCQYVLDWIPVRLLALGYALVGDFMPTFKYWLSHVLSGLQTTAEIASQSGLIALDSENMPVENVSVQENKLALNLVDRTLIVYVVVLALVVIGRLI